MLPSGPTDQKVPCPKPPPSAARPWVHSFTVCLFPQMDQPRWDHLQVSLPHGCRLFPPRDRGTAFLPNPGFAVLCGRVAEPPPHPAFVPLGSLVLWPRSREVPGRMCVTSLQSLTQTSLQAPLSPSSPKSYWARESEGRPQAQSPLQHRAPLSTPQPSLPLAWAPGDPAASPSLRNEEWASAWDTALLPCSSLLSQVDGPVR